MLSTAGGDDCQFCVWDLRAFDCGPHTRDKRYGMSTSTWANNSLSVLQGHSECVHMQVGGRGGVGWGRQLVVTRTVCVLRAAWMSYSIVYPCHVYTLIY